MNKSSSFENFVSDKLPFTPEELQEFKAFLNFETFPKNSFLLNVGDVSNKVFFIEKGVIREFTPNENADQEQTHWILDETNFTYSVESFLENTPSLYAIQALEETKVAYFKKDEIEQLIATNPKIPFFIIMIYQIYLSKVEKHLRLLKIQSNQAKLDEFYDQHPNLRNRVSLKYIASFLNMHPSSLSKLRAKKLD